MTNTITISTIKGRGVPVPGNDIDTDRIIPARYLRCVTFDGLGEHAFEDDRQQNPQHSFNNPTYKGAVVLVSNNNFGCGSSREHAPQALAKWGIQAVVAESFAEIFFGNCTALGIPCLSMSHEEADELIGILQTNPETIIEVDVLQARVVAHHSDQTQRYYQASIKPGAQQALLNGTWNTTEVLLQAEQLIEKTVDNLPYISGW